MDANLQSSATNEIFLESNCDAPIAYSKLSARGVPNCLLLGGEGGLGIAPAPAPAGATVAWA